jgi:rSAM/selenodomain-associated transferase 2
MDLSIIIPVLDEAARLPALLAQLAPLQARGAQVIVADGGSRDGSRALLPATVVWLEAPRGRALQMNAGAALARGRVLWFLHADSRLPPAADALIEQALADGRHCWGRFDVQIEGRPRMLALIAQLMNWRSRLSAIATGDQGIFVLRSSFETLGGYAAQPLMEDIELSARLRRLSRPACIRERLVTSGRRWEERGVWRTILLMWRLRWSYWRGVPAEKLAAAYK